MEFKIEHTLKIWLKKCAGNQNQKLDIFLKKSSMSL